MPYINDDLKDIVNIKFEEVWEDIEEHSEVLNQHSEQISALENLNVNITNNIKAITEEVIPQMNSEIRSLLLEEKTRAELIESELAENIKKNC